VTTTIPFSGLNHAACALASPLLRTPRLRDRTSGRLPACWLGFDRTGLSCQSRITRWAATANFSVLPPHLPSLRIHLGTSTPGLGAWRVAADFVLAGEKAGSKLAKAQKLGVAVSDLAGFMKMIGRA
jgi:hypothetical protein